MTNKQKEDLETIKFFIPKDLSKIKINSEDIAKFLENSEKGLHKSDIKQSHFKDGFNVLISAKKWRGIHMGLWEDSILDGSIGYFTLLGGENTKEILPKSVVNFMKKEMFRGKNEEIIEKIYKKITNK